MRSSHEFRRVFGEGGRFVDGNFVIIAAANGGGSARLGLAISRRAARRAVDRNRIKRIVRESFRHVAARLPAIDVVVLARGRAADQSAALLFSSLGRQWQKIGRDDLHPRPSHQGNTKNHG